MARKTRLTPNSEQNEEEVEPLMNAPPPNPSALLRLIETVAIDPQADVEKLDRMITMYERLKAQEAEFAFNAAKGRLLQKLSRIKIVKNRLALNEIENGKYEYETFRYAA